MRKIALGLVDSRPMSLGGMARLLGSIEDFEVVATGQDSSDAAAIAESGNVDVLIFDIDAQEDGTNSISRILSNSTRTRIIVLTESNSVDHAVKALEAGATGYVFKSGTLDELINAIRFAAQGQTYVAQRYAAQVVLALRTASARERSPSTELLSLREKQILKLLLEGKKNKEIAEKLFISEKTVKYYMTLLMHKMQARNRIEVVLAAQKMYHHSQNASAPKEHVH